MAELEIGTAPPVIESEKKDTLKTFSEGEKIFLKDLNCKATVRLVLSEETDTDHAQYLVSTDTAPRSWFPTVSVLMMKEAEMPKEEVKETETPTEASWDAQKPVAPRAPRAARKKDGKGVRSIMTQNASDGIIDYETLRKYVLAERPEVKEITIKTMFCDLKREGVIKI